MCKYIFVVLKMCDYIILLSYNCILLTHVDTVLNQQMNKWIVNKLILFDS